MRVAGVVLLAFLFMAFDAEQAKNWIDGQWQGGVVAWSLAVNSAAGTGVFIDGGKRTAGAFTIEEVVGRSARFRIGGQEFTIHFGTKTGRVWSSEMAIQTLASIE